MTKKKLRLAGAIALLLGITIGCADPLDPQRGVVVFPAEAYLGGTVAMLISTNYGGPYETEAYGLHKDNVEVRVFWGPGSEDYVLADADTFVVFDVQLSPSSRAALNAPGAYSTVIVFDLPTSLHPALYPYPHTDVKIYVRRIGGGPVSFGFVNVLGEQDLAAGYGKPTDLGVGFDSDPVVPGNDGLGEIDEGLQPQTMIRLRAVHHDEIPPEKQPGFGKDPGQQIGSIEFWVIYHGGCMENLRAYPNSEAAGANVILGPVMGGGAFTYRKVILVDSNGFTLDKPLGAGAPPEAAGEGPFLDLAFDWTGSAGCPALEDIAGEVDYSGLLVTDLEGQALIEQTGLVNEFFTEHLIDLVPGG